MEIKNSFETHSITLTSDQHAQLLTFKLDDQEYALDIANVVQVVRMVAITPAPKAPNAVEGILNLRGKVIPVIDLRKRFGLRPQAYGLNNHLVIAKTDQRMMALIVDAVNEVLSTPASSLDLSSEISLQMAEYLSAVGKLGDRLLLILDLDRVMAFEEERHVKDVLVELSSALTSGNGKKLSID